MILSPLPTSRPSYSVRPLPFSKPTSLNNSLSKFNTPASTRNLQVSFFESMAQRTEKEETEFKVVPDTISLCVKCGVAGNSAANNLCQNCFNANAAASTSTAASTGGGKALNHVFVEKSFRSSSSARFLPENQLDSAEICRDLKVEASRAPDAAPTAKREINRCSGCRRKVGLTGFRCRCGELFCADHRYSDRHDCSYDYKAVGREAITRENPVVKAAKIVKI